MGSGKSYLAKKISERTNVPVLFLDDIFWEGKDEFSKKRPSWEINQDLRDFMTNESFVVEGVYSSLQKRIMRQIDTLIYVDIPWNECLNNLNKRKSEKIEWASSYYVKERHKYGTRVYSKGTHDEQFDLWNGNKIRLYCQKDVNDFIERLV